MLSSAESRERKRVWNETEVLLLETVEEGIEQRPFYRRSAERKGSMKR